MDLQLLRCVRCHSHCVPQRDEVTGASSITKSRDGTNEPHRSSPLQVATRETPNPIFIPAAKKIDDTIEEYAAFYMRKFVYGEKRWMVPVVTNIWSVLGPRKLCVSSSSTFRTLMLFQKSRRFVTASQCVKLNSEPSEDAYDNLSPLAQEKVQRLLSGMQNGDRGSLAEAITLVETQHPVKKRMAKVLLNSILRMNKGNKESLRVGLSGSPGAGKSSLIEILGKELTGSGKKVAVLAVDPSSATTGGSLLGDKTRMPELTRDMNAFIRPSPTQGHLGGVTRCTNEAIVLCEFAGYDIIIVETVGVGQSEYAVSNMVDIFIVLIPPGGGDELQGVKRGIVERADILLVTKCDGDLKEAALRTQYEYKSSLKYMRPNNPNWKTKVLSLSAKTREGLDQFWSEVLSFRSTCDKDNAFHLRRAEQRVIWVWTHVQDGLQQFIMEDLNLKSKTDALIQQVEQGSVTPGTAADKIIQMFTHPLTKNNKGNKGGD